MAARRQTEVPERALALRCRRGEWEAAKLALTPLADAGSGAASVTLAELCAATGDWLGCVTHARRYLVDPSVGLTGNLFTDTTRLVRRAAMRELERPDLIDDLVDLIPPRWHPMRDATLLRDFVPPTARPGPADVASYEKAVADARKLKRFKNSPTEFARHCFALAHAFKHDDELLRLYESAADDTWWFDPAVDVARVLARRGDADRAWLVLQDKLPTWLPVDALQVFPVVLLVDPWLSPMMTVSRRKQVLSTPRGDGRHDTPR